MKTSVKVQAKDLAKGPSEVSVIVTDDGDCRPIKQPSFNGEYAGHHRFRHMLDQ